MKYYWTEETLEYFTGLYTLSENDYYEEVEKFVKNNCTLEDGETYKDLMVDLVNQTTLK